MKKIFVTLLLCIGVATAVAQSKVKFGHLSYDALFKAMPEYAEMQTQLAGLRAKYAQEAEYNETGFKRMFAEYLQGQKDFPQNILLKRQRDLQEAMEKSLAFRRECDSLLLEAEKELKAPLHKKLSEAIRLVGLEHGYEAIYNLDAQAVPFLHPSLSEDVTVYVRQKLEGK